MDQNIFKVAIIIPSKNRASFLIRQLRYYASNNSPHPIYIADASTGNDLERITQEIKNLSSKLKIVFKNNPTSFISTSMEEITKEISEDYACLIGDDDYQIPETLTKCAQFLKDNKDYSTVSGLAISFRLTNNSPYGELKYLADYPRRAIVNNSAADRVIDFLSDYYVPLFSVHPTKVMRYAWSNLDKVKDVQFAAEIIPATRAIIAGRSAILNELGFVRQIHGSNFALPNLYDWITDEKWHEPYKNFENILAQEIAIKDDISNHEAALIIKKGFWGYLKKNLSREYRTNYPVGNTPNYWHQLYMLNRRFIADRFSILKRIYRSWYRPQIKGIHDIHYEVLQPESKYYKQFKPVIESFGNI